MKRTVSFGHSALQLTVDVSGEGPVSLSMSSDVDGTPPVPVAHPLVEVLAADTGRAQASHRFSDTTIGRRLRYTGHEQSRDGAWHVWRIDLRDEVTGLCARVRVRSADGVGALQVLIKIENDGSEPQLLFGVSSFAAGFPAPFGAVDLLHGDSEWLGEGRWTRRPLREAAVDLNLGSHGQHGRGCFAVVSTGTWSTGTHLPTGGMIDRETGSAWLWQIEHHGPWRWETGERLDGAYVALLGPNDLDHQWSQLLAPGESFTTVPVSIAVSTSDLEGAVAAMTQHRRALTRPHRDRSTLPVVFNDYMNTLMGDPTTAKLLPLIDAAADAGAEAFCIDAGWYDNGGTWWDSVGEWQPSQTRFPRGIEEVLARVRGHGMVPGLWLEPEVIGVRSPMADKLPPAAFLQRRGIRLAEHGRFHLDLRHPAAVSHLDDVVDRLVEQLGVGYLKLDYNIDPGPGTDLDADSAGAGLLGHNLAHLAWLDRVLDRHPDLILENCASGAMRMDYALLSRMQLQSTSDQQEFTLYPPIAAAAPLSILPEQSASWAYPQPGMTGEEIAFTMCTSMLGRLYLSGRLDSMAPDQLESVRAAVRVYKSIRTDLAAATPVWPLGLPHWNDPWLSLAMRHRHLTYLAIWYRGVAASSATLSLPHLRGADVAVDVLYPNHRPAWTCDWAANEGLLHVAAEPVSARLFRITPKD